MMTQVYPFSEPRLGAPFFSATLSNTGLVSWARALPRQGGLVVEVLGLLVPYCSLVTRLEWPMSDLPGGEGDELTWLF